ncbi:cytochrome bc1 complex cytochrome b subunit [Nonomuraea wenchangensis]|uniref:Cytochrome bc1 complex cytochrome b subunit n=1 Tax=Nonomuraea wenchangensis TaxID=568860 RepID=A0A1I0C240_9ACTN|nr:ubiquinol-cytochrome c reductase cytochrome b subunit [Nonomuraea wenchangensis]SET13148.1 ubiquinol-cytochrome c reductase cytochrome b subunit [Nonomuraea wenchangensis]
MILRRLGRTGWRWVDGRLRAAEITRTTLAKVFPDHWTFMLGEIALYSFITLVATGVFLTFFFVPSSAETVYGGSYAPLHGSYVSAAYASAVELSFDVRGGLLFRQVHHWSALIFLGAIAAHACRIFFTGAFRKPREINWLVGVTLLLTSLANGFVGYSLLDDLLSGTGLRIGYSIALSVPVVGSWAAFLLFGGEFPGNLIISRLYGLHVLLLPALIATLIAVHMAILIRQKHTHFPGPGRRDSNVVGSKMWPTYAFRSLALLSGVLAVTFGLGALAQINPVWIWGPFKPANATTPGQPDFYMGWVEGMIRLFPAAEFRVFGYLVPSPFLPAVALPLLMVLVMYAWPWLDRLVTGDRGRHHVDARVRDRPGRTAVGVWAVAQTGLLLFAASDDLIARWLKAPVEDVIAVLRIVVLAGPPVIAAVAYVLARALRAYPESRLTTLEPRQVGAALGLSRARPPRRRVRESVVGGRPDVPSEDAPQVVDAGGRHAG